MLVVALGPTAVRGALADLRRRPGSAALLGFFAIALPFSLITLGEHTVPSGLTAVLIAPASLFVALFAPFLDPSESIDRRQGVGMVIGLAGVALVVGVESVHSTGQLLGALAMIGAAASYALSGFVVKGRYGRLTSTQTSLVSVLTASVMTLPFAIATAPSQLPGLRAMPLRARARRDRDRARLRDLLPADARRRRRRARRSSPTSRRASRSSTARSSSTRRSRSPPSPGWC